MSEDEKKEGQPEFIKYIVLFAAILIISLVGSFLMTGYTPKTESHAVGMSDTLTKQTVQIAAKPVNLNTAGLTELMSLPGVGETTANRIITFRNEYGAFRSVDELRLVSGIGEKKFEELKPLITVEEPGEAQ